MRNGYDKTKDGQENYLVIERYSIIAPKAKQNYSDSQFTNIILYCTTTSK